MIEYILIIFFIIFILINENILKFLHLQILYNNWGLIKFILKNILYTLPLITLYFNYETIINIMQKSQNNKRNVT